MLTCLFPHRYRIHWRLVSFYAFDTRTFGNRTNERGKKRPFASSVETTSVEATINLEIVYIFKYSIFYKRCIYENYRVINPRKNSL